MTGGNPSLGRLARRENWSNTTGTRSTKKSLEDEALEESRTSMVVDTRFMELLAAAVARNERMDQE